jgi:hypothetical protein
MLPPLRLTVRLNATRNHRNHASAARSAAGRPGKRTDGLVTAGMNGTPSTREESAQPASTNGLKPSAYHVADGRRTRISMGSKEL